MKFRGIRGKDGKLLSISFLKKRGTISVMHLGRVLAYFRHFYTLGMLLKSSMRTKIRILSFRDANLLNKASCSVRV